MQIPVLKYPFTICIVRLGSPLRSAVYECAASWKSSSCGEVLHCYKYMVYPVLMKAPSQHLCYQCPQVTPDTVTRYKSMQRLNDAQLLERIQWQMQQNSLLQGYHCYVLSLFLPLFVLLLLLYLPQHILHTKSSCILILYAIVYHSNLYAFAAQSSLLLESNNSGWTAVLKRQ